MENPPYQTYGGTNQAATDSSWDEDLMDLMKLYYGYEMSTRRPSFSNPPLTPEQKQLWDLYLQTLQNPATKDNAATVSNIGHQILGGYQNLSWDAPKTSTGQTGYRGSNTSFTMPQAPAPTAQIPSTPSRPAMPTGGGGGGGGPDGYMSIEPTEGRGRLPTVAGVGGQGIGGFTSGSDIKPWDHDTYGDLNARRFPGYTTGPYDPNSPAGDAAKGVERGDTPNFKGWGDLIRTYGVPAAKIIMGFYTSNPILGLQGAIDAWKRSQGKP